MFDNQRKTTTLKHIHTEIIQKLNDIFNVKDPEQKREYDRYMSLVSKMIDVSVQDLSYATELPRYIDGFLLKKTDKESVKNIPIEEILGK